MDGLRKVVAVFAFMVVVMAFIAPAMAQSYGGGYTQPAYQGSTQPAYQGGAQQGQAGQAEQGQGQQGGLKASNKDIMQTIDETQGASIFAAAVKAAGYDQTLSQQEGPYMVFAPSDKAFQDAGITDVSSLDDSTVKNIVENCIVSKVTEPQQGSDSFAMTSMSGQKINAKKTSNGIMVNGIKVSNVVKADNGMLIITDGIVGMT